MGTPAESHEAPPEVPSHAVSPVQRDLRRDLSQARALLDDAMAKARLVEGGWTPAHEAPSKESLAELERWEERLAGPGSFNYVSCRNEILTLARRRAYLLPAIEIPAE